MNHLDYLDQASFLGLRALGRGPLVQLTWIYEHPVDLEALRRLQVNLGRGLLGRCIQRSVLPFGRHRWVAWTPPDELEVAPVARSRSEVADWCDEQLGYPIDPEFGPPWRMAVQPLVGGGAAVTLIASHTVCDGRAISFALVEASRGAGQTAVYPPTDGRSRSRALIDDAAETIRALPGTLRAIAAAIRLARGSKGRIASSASHSLMPEELRRSEKATVPCVVAYIDGQLWDACAEMREGTANSLFAGFSAVLGQSMGRQDQNGMIKLFFPVDERLDADKRANALSGIEVLVDPSVASTSLVDIRSEVKRCLSTLSAETYEPLTVLPLAPFVPRKLVRRLGFTLGPADAVSCSNIGYLPGAINRPDGTDAEYISGRQMASWITADVLDQIGGALFVASGRANGKVFLTVSGWQVGAVNSKEVLMEKVVATLEEFGLHGIIE